jgi:hypothetical protein
LDDLPVDDPRAVRSRVDLRRVNALMGHRRLIRRALPTARPGRLPLHIADLGAGDGEFMLGLARSLGQPFAGTRLTLVDRLPAVRPATLAGFGAAGWAAETAEADVLDWLESERSGHVDVLTANLFLHHFEDRELRAVLAGCAARARLFLACEPRRSYRGLAGAAALRLIGCNRVTRHDAIASVRAGFGDGDLSRLWPPEPHWEIGERPAGLFSHFFRASLSGPEDSGKP